MNATPNGWDKVEGAPEQPIGFLVNLAGEPGYRVACADCTASRAKPVYLVNVFPYSQTCCDCGKTLVAGQGCGAPAHKCERHAQGPHTHWCELFNGR